MALKTYKPVTPSRRQLVLVDRSGLFQGKPVKTLTEGKNASGGRNNHGRITVRFRGGGHKQAYRRIDFKRRKFDVAGRVERIEYDPNRTGFIALIKYEDGELAYILAPQRLAQGDTVVAGEHVDVKPGNAMPLANMPMGTIVHNIEFKIGKGGQLARSAGAYAQIVGRDQEYVILRLNSGEQRLVHGRCMASVGAVSNPDHMNISIGKAGRTRWQVHHQIHHFEPPRAEEEEIGAKNGAFGVERSVRGRLSAQEGGGRPLVGPSRHHQDLDPAVDHSAAIRRPDVRRLQRAEAHSGAGHRGDGRPQVRRVRADAHLLRPLGRPQGEARVRRGIRR